MCEFNSYQQFPKCDPVQHQWLGKELEKRDSYLPNAQLMNSGTILKI